MEGANEPATEPTTGEIPVLPVFSPPGGKGTAPLPHPAFRRLSTEETMRLAKNDPHEYAAYVTAMREGFKGSHS